MIMQLGTKRYKSKPGAGHHCCDCAFYRSACIDCSDVRCTSDEGVEPRIWVECNEDGDTIEDMQSIWKAGGALDWKQVYGVRIGDWWTFTKDTDRYGPDDDDWRDVAAVRVSAKHNNVFTPVTMDFETWARATLKRGMICRLDGEQTSTGKTYYCDRISDKGDKLWVIGKSSGGFGFKHPRPGWTAVPKEPARVNCCENAQATIAKQKERIEQLQKPRIKRDMWMNVYEVTQACCCHNTRETADKEAAEYRAACIPVTIDCEVGEGL